MPNTAISGLSSATPTTLDYVEILDVSDTTMGVSGSNKKVLVSSLMALATVDLSAYATTAYVVAGYQPLDSDLTAIAALTTTTFGRSLLTVADAAALRTAAGLGTLATQSGTFSGTSSGTNTGDQDLSGYAAKGSANEFATGQVLHGTTAFRQTAGTAGIDEIQLSHNGTRGLIVSKDGDLDIDNTSSGAINLKYFTSLTLLSTGGSGVTIRDSNAATAIINYNQAGTVGWTANSAGMTVGNTFHLHWQSANIWYSGSPHVGLTPLATNALKVTDGSTGLGRFLFSPASLSDAAAPNDSVYYSTTAGKLVYKDSGGTVNNLY